MWTDVCKKLEAKVKEKKAENKMLVLKGEIIRSLEALQEDFGEEEVLEALEDESFISLLRTYYTEKNEAKKNSDAKEKMDNSISSDSIGPEKVYKNIVMLLRKAANAIVAQ